MSTSGGNNKDDPREDRDARDTTPIDPADIPEDEMAGVDAGWDLGTDDLLGPDEGPTVVDGSLEMAAAEVLDQPQVTREPSKTFLGMGPEDQLAPVREAAEVKEISQPKQPEPPSPEPLPHAPEPDQPEPPPAKPVSSLANLAAQDVAFKDTLPGDLNMLTPEVEPAEPEPKARPTPPVTEAALVQPNTTPAQRRPPAETEPTEPIRLPTGPGSRKSDSDLALAATMAPNSESMAHSPPLAPDAESGLRTLDAPVAQAPAAPAPAAPAPAAPAPAAPQLEESTQTVEPITQQPRAPARAPSNTTLTVLWVLAMISVIVAVALFLLRPSI